MYFFPRKTELLIKDNYCKTNLDFELIASFILLDQSLLFLVSLIILVQSLKYILTIYFKRMSYLRKLNINYALKESMQACTYAHSF